MRSVGRCAQQRYTWSADMANWWRALLWTAASHSLKSRQAITKQLLSWVAVRQRI